MTSETDRSIEEQAAAAVRRDDADDDVTALLEALIEERVPEIGAKLLDEFEARIAERFSSDAKDITETNAGVVEIVELLDDRVDTLEERIEVLEGCEIEPTDDQLRGYQ